MQITKIAIYRPVTTLMTTLALVFLGLVSWRELSVQYYPDISFPAMAFNASAQDQDLTPEETNDTVTRPVEKLVASAPGIQEMYTQTGGGYVWGYAKFERGTDMRFRVIEIQDKLNQWRAAQEDTFNVQVSPYSTDELAGRLMTLILSVPVGQEFQSSHCTDLIRRKLRSIDGVAKVDIAGEMSPNITLDVERDRLLSHGFDVDGMVRAINGSFAEKSWLGAIPRPDDANPFTAGTAPNIYLESEIHSVGELLSRPVDMAGATAVNPYVAAETQTEEGAAEIITPLTIGDLARPSKDIEEQTSIYRFNGKKAVRVEVTKERERNTIAMARAVRDRIDELNAELPEGFALTIQHDEAVDLENMIAKIAKLAAFGAFLAMIVLQVFVRNWRLALIVALAIPTSLFITFNAMYATGISINVLSLLGLTVGVGMLVDNAIVVVENVFRHAQSRRHDAREAAWKGSREVTHALAVSTSTNLVVFVPFFFIDDEIILIMKELALSVAYPMMVSLLVAVTLIPMLASKVCGQRSIEALPSSRRRPLRLFWTPWTRSGRRPRNFIREFVFFIAKAYLRHPVRLLVSVGVFLVATFIISGIKVSMRGGPRGEKVTSIPLYGRAPLGSDIDATDGVFQKKEAEIADLFKEITGFESFASRFTADGGQIDLHVAKPYQSLERRDFITAYQSRLQSSTGPGRFQFYPFPQTSVRQLESAEQSWRSNWFFPEAVIVTGENLEAMLDAGERVLSFLDDQDQVNQVRIETPAGPPEAHFIPDHEMFQILQADPGSLQTFFRSRSDRGLPTQLKIMEADIERQVVVRSVLSERDKEKAEQEKKEKQSLAELARADVSLYGGGSVELRQLGHFKLAKGISLIQKKDRQRQVKISFSLKDQYYRGGQNKAKQEILKAIQKQLTDVRMPLGVSAHLEGALEDTRTEMATWKKLGKLGLLALFLIMAFFFNSIFVPIVILITIPLASIGALWGLIFLNVPFDTQAMVGVLILGGLAVNNGILLIEYARQMEREQGFRRPRALLTAVAHRVRPILMTSLTTVFGLAPILFSKEAEEVHSLVAVAIGGIVVSGLLSLIVVPTFYNVLSLAGDRLRDGLSLIRSFARRPFSGWLLPWRGMEPATEAGPVEMTSSTAGATLPIARRTATPSATIDGLVPVAVSGRLQVSVENISKIYPVFHFQKIFNLAPSRHYPIGHRPPEGSEALRHVSLEIEPGMFGLLGPNGAGKTTLMKILTGMVHPTYGVARVLGFDTRSQGGDVRRHISYLPQSFGVYEALTLDQYLNFFAGLPDMPSEFQDRDYRRRRIEECIEWVGLSEARGKPMKRFSGGMRQRAGIAQILLHPRPVIIVDEPTGGLDPVERVRFRLLLSQLARTRIVILSTHIVDDITSSCRKVAVLNRGQVLYQGGLEHIQRAARNRIWDLTVRAEEKPAIPPRHILYRKHLGEQILYHYVSSSPLPGSIPVTPTFEDAYVAHLFEHDATRSDSTVGL